MNVLIVEDDDYKASDIARALEESDTSVEIDKASSVTSALRTITSRAHDLVVLDMSLPTFDLGGPGGGGSPQGQGGLEVLRLSRRLKQESAFVIVTQYPDIEIDGVDVSLDDAAPKLTDRFGSRVLKCIHYQFDDDAWKIALLAALISIGK